MRYSFQFMSYWTSHANALLIELLSATTDCTAAAVAAASACNSSERAVAAGSGSKRALQLLGIPKDDAGLCRVTAILADAATGIAATTAAATSPRGGLRATAWRVVEGV